VTASKAKNERHRTAVDPLAPLPDTGKKLAKRTSKPVATKFEKANVTKRKTTR
jgi:hypothetical protein